MSIKISGYQARCDKCFNHLHYGLNYPSYTEIIRGILDHEWVFEKNGDILCHRCKNDQKKEK